MISLPRAKASTRAIRSDGGMGFLFVGEVVANVVGFNSTLDYFA